jgi:hypothetical protein
MSEPKEVLKAMSAVAGAGYRSQVTIFQQDDPPPPPPPGDDENTGSPPPPPPPGEGG